VVYFEKRAYQGKEFNESICEQNFVSMLVLTNII